MKEQLDAINNNAGSSAPVFNYYLKFANMAVFDEAKLLEPTPALAAQVDAATRARIKGTRSLTKTLDDSVCSESVKIAARTPAELSSPGRGSSQRARPGRR
ncbi:MAG: hypothetical protein KDD37_06130 [Bdellovibrionales bacterium]|nr:hypothetical protein [Bdellovibrionales bacterium]